MIFYKSTSKGKRKTKNDDDVGGDSKDSASESNDNKRVL